MSDSLCRCSWGCIYLGKEPMWFEYQRLQSENHTVLNLNDYWKFLQFKKFKYVSLYIKHPYWRQSKEYSQFRVHLYETKYGFMEEEVGWAIPASLLQMCSDMCVTMESSERKWLWSCSLVGAPLSTLAGIQFLPCCRSLTKCEILALINTQALPRSPSWP